MYSLLLGQILVYLHSETEILPSGHMTFIQCHMVASTLIRNYLNVIFPLDSFILPVYPFKMILLPKISNKSLLFTVKNWLTFNRKMVQNFKVTYLPLVFRETILSNECRPRSDDPERGV